jgi:hypothetical protein
MALRIRDEGNNVGPVRSKGQKTEPGEWSALGLPDPAAGSPFGEHISMARTSSRAKLPPAKEWKKRAAQVREKVREAERVAVGISDFPDYRGQHVANRMHGFGTIDWVDGASYSGSWENGRPSGFGVYRVVNGRWYEGEWKNGRQHGHGRQLFQDGSSYFGEWVYDHADGFGRWEYADGGIYGGELNRDQRHGDGIYYEPDKKACWEGEWRFDKFVDGIISRAGGKHQLWRNGKAVRETG